MCVCVCIYIPSLWSLPHSSHLTSLGHHRAPDWASCTIQQFPTSCFTLGSVNMSMMLSQVALPSPSPVCPQVHSLFLCLHSFSAHRLISTILFRVHMCTLIYNIWFSDLLQSAWQALGSSTSLELVEIYFLELSHWKSPWCREKLKAGEEGGKRGWDGWMASPTQYTWVWTSSGSWWWTGKPGVLQSMGLQRVRYNWATELNWWLSK